ncbi:MAG: hypothetical protein GY758_04460 [Fuerstiella sp.]|nr:hypothetical protein [Fuerstiella sp.]MCP4510186.1 hypothetical protein [Fuerstiella sp.]
MKKQTCLTASLALCLLLTSSNAEAKDFYLTIGGGSAPPGNQASLEKNVLFYQRLLHEQKRDLSRNDIYFADGRAAGDDLQVMDRESLPKANRLMAEFFGSQRNLGLLYRNHKIVGVRDDTTPASIRSWFTDVGPTMDSGDRLMLYVTAHGHSSNDRDSPHNTTISLWNNKSIRVSEVVNLLDTLPQGVRVVAVMVQCHAGGFARFIYNEGDSDKGLSSQHRCGFFATVHDRPAAGCTPEINEATYVEYSTYFWEAIAGHTRAGKPIDVPDYDNDGRISFAEAHAYTVLRADTIDLPITTSGEFLGIESLFANDRYPELLSDMAAWDSVLPLATPAERAILEGLSDQLQLTGNDRIEVARRQVQQLRRRRGGSRGQRVNPAVQLRQRIATDLKRQWPGLANVLNPVAVDLLTIRKDEFISAIEKHRDYKRYREQVDTASVPPDTEKRKVKYERFIRTAENIILLENLRLLDDTKRLEQYQSILEAESESLSAVLADSPVDATAHD